MQVSNVTGPGASDQNTMTSVSGGQSTKKKSFAELLSELNDYTKGTPSQQLEKQILARLGITQADLDKMSPEDRAKVMAKVRDMLRQELGEQQQAQKQKTIVV